METNAQNPSDCPVKSIEEKKSLDRLKVLHSLAQKKDRKVYGFFKKNAMNLEHYKEFMKARITSDNSDTIKTKSYVVVYTLNTGGSAPFSYFVIGVDDTTDKLFCHRLPSGNRRGRCTDEGVRNTMGFDTECLEVGKRIRVQGDLTMQIMKQTDTPEKLFEFMAHMELASQVSDAIGEDDGNTTYTHLNDIFDLSLEPFSTEDNHKFIKEELGRRGMTAEAEELERVRNTDQYFPYIHKMARELKASIMYKEELDFLKKNKQRITQRIYDQMSRRESRYTIRQGEHKITLTASVEVTGRHVEARHGHIIRERPRRTIFYVLRPSMITLEHKEHGRKEIMIDKPSRISFGLLNRYQEERPRTERIRHILRANDLDVLRNERDALMNEIVEEENRIASLRAEG